MKIQLKSEEHLSIKQPGSTDVNAIDIYTSGNTGNVKVSGNSRFEGNVNVTDAAANNGCVLSYDPTEECIKFTFN